MIAWDMEDQPSISSSAIDFLSNFGEVILSLCLAFPPVKLGQWLLLLRIKDCEGLKSYTNGGHIST